MWPESSARKSERSGLHRTPSALTNDVRKRLKKLLLLLLRGLLLRCRLLRGLLLRCHHSYLLRLVIRTRGSMVWRDAFPCATSWTIFSAHTYLCTPTGFPLEPLRVRSRNADGSGAVVGSPCRFGVLR